MNKVLANVRPESKYYEGQAQAKPSLSGWNRISAVIIGWAA